jgi:hypothetical protein
LKGKAALSWRVVPTQIGTTKVRSELRAYISIRGEIISAGYLIVPTAEHTKIDMSAAACPTTLKGTPSGTVKDLVLSKTE